jgi:hypothetical protein
MPRVIYHVRLPFGRSTKEGRGPQLRIKMGHDGRLTTTSERCREICAGAPTSVRPRAPWDHRCRRRNASSPDSCWAVSTVTSKRRMSPMTATSGTCGPDVHPGIVIPRRRATRRRMPGCAPMQLVDVQSESGGRNDAYGFALAAHPGTSQGAVTPADSQPMGTARPARPRSLRVPVRNERRRYAPPRTSPEQGSASIFIPVHHIMERC